jgi:TolB-like protein/DNA-binding winged helix-turn-helix (wHTH) protein
MRIGEWSVDPATHQIERDGQTVTLEARTMRLLVCLAERAGETVSFDDLMDQVWPGTVVTQDSVYRAVTSLRRLLADNPRKPEYIVTVPRRGYRLVAKVVAEADAVAGKDSGAVPAGAASADAAPLAPATLTTTPPDRASATRRWRYAYLLGTGALAAAVLAFIFIGHPRSQSVAVLPFLDLTSQSMDEEYLADGLTEELITRLGKIPTLEVPAPTASFYFKGKQLSLSAIAKELNVAYVVDGSIRRSGQTLRVTTRLVRADDGFVIWSEVYDRNSADLLEVQDDIAGHVAQAIEKTTSKRAR